MRYLFISVLAVIILAGNGCSYNQPGSVSSSTETAPTNSQAGAKSTAKQIAYIKNSSQKQDKYYLDLDYAQMYGGDEAVTVALNETGCSREKISDGNCAPSLNNGFYISNPDRATTTLLLPPTVKIMIEDKGAQQKSISTENFIKLWKEKQITEKTPFIVSQENGVITKLAEQYLP